MSVRTIDWISKLRHFLQVLAFTLAVATIQYAFMPERNYGTMVLYSVLIGSFTWATIDLLREWFPSAAETGWPAGWRGPALVFAGIATGYLAGTNLGDLLCKHYLDLPASNPPSLRTSLLITVLAGVAGSYYFYSTHKSSYLESKMAEARLHASEARLKLLETQLEPHMLFNTLANLRVLISVDPQQAQTMLDHLIAYLRATLTASRATQHPLEDEFERLRDYLELMAVRMGPRLRYTLELPPELGQAPVPPLLLQPLVENAIRHGLEPQVSGGLITVRASLQPANAGPAASRSQLVLEVHDTGVGLAAASAPQGSVAGTRFGLAQARERLATLYGSEGTLELIAHHAGGTCATVRFPYQTTAT
jgi:signal transduction histidine kinase